MEIKSLSPGIASSIPKAVIVFLIPNVKHSGFIENHMIGCPFYCSRVIWLEEDFSTIYLASRMSAIILPT